MTVAPRTVLVTGRSTGIGRDLAQRLSLAGPLDVTGPRAVTGR